MGCKLLFGAAVVVLGVVIAYMSGAFSPAPGPPEIGDGWWGRGDKPTSKEDESVRKFQVNFSEDGLIDLKDRLRKTRWFESMEDTQFNYGMRPEYMKTVVDYWLNEYDWRKMEKQLNQYQHYKTKIEGIDIHFMRAVPKLRAGQKARPIMMVHGWPGSFYEFYKMIPMMIDPTNHGGTEEDVFEVICPSLPGYGFSEAAHKKGLTPKEAGRIFDKLMTRLGFTSYYIQGGDWGAAVVDQMGGLFPSRVRGLHTNLVATGSPVLANIVGQLFPSLVLDEPNNTGILLSKNKLGFLLMESGYLHLQATKPDTVGHALLNSPVGLAAYIMEKFSSWTNKDWRDLDDGGLGAHWTKDELLTNVMIYWVSGCITSSMRLYKETFSQLAGVVPKYLNTAPAGLADLPNELARSQRSWASAHFTDIVSFSTFPTGGHFAAFEVPELLVADIRQFVRKVEQRLIAKKDK